ncbi:tRNA isopentenyltransferase [Lentinula aff. lateritia]|uniref:tRNA isopentenyltransferase n=1 Tax=Lentinula aff. lateritia TaxID=2804960 RepID=A0ACC1UBX1_9AGAR|nr:tRNA isopentenyltransferase [Lentinula aff. lateritia]
MKALRPIIAIFGTTGVGKSNLAVEIALHLANSGRQTWNNAKVINADAMQVYAGMDVITNKIPVPEMQGVEHALMGFKSPHEQYVVGQWVKDAIDAIDDAHEKNQIPIIVGGTSYWIQHLLFPNRLAKNIHSVDNDEGFTSSTFETSEELASLIETLSPDLFDLFSCLPEAAPSADSDPEEAFRLYNLLKALDESVAVRWHWKDTRKVLRSIRIIQETGRKPSELIHKQSQDILQARRFRTLCFWVYSKPETLKSRLDFRVDKMLEQGLLDEVTALRELLKKPESSDENAEEINLTSDYTFGIFQSIGYREFHKYLSSPNPTEEEFLAAVKNMKTSTRQYAKRQTTWLRNKLLPMLYSANETKDSNSPPDTFTYLLDATELGESWDIDVREPAVDITTAFLDHQPLPDPSTLSNVAKEVLNVERKDTTPSAVLNARRKFICPVCTSDPTQPYMVEEKEWKLHQKSRVHKRRAYKPLSAAEIEERKRQGRCKKNSENASGFEDDLGKR